MRALGQVFAPGREVVEPGFDLLEDGEAVGLAFAPDGVRPGPAAAQAGFDLIEFLHLQEDPGGILPFGFGVEKIAPRMGHAAGQLDGMALSGPLFDKTVIRFPAVTLDDSPVVGRNDAPEAVGPAPGAPREVAEVAHRIVKDPEVAGAADAFAGRILILHGSLIGLHITVSKDFLLGGGKNDAAGVGRHAGPPAEGLAGKRDAGAGVKLFDAVIRKVLLEAEDQSVGEQARGGDAAGLEEIQRGGDGGGERVVDRDIFMPQDDRDTEMARSVVEEFGFFAGPGGAPGGGVGFDFPRCDDDGGGRQVFDEFGKAALFPHRWGGRTGGGRASVRTGASGGGFLRRRGSGGGRRFLG